MTTNHNHATDLDKIADKMDQDGIDGSAILRNMAGDLRASAGDGRQARTLHQMTLVQAVANAGNDDSMLTRLANLRSRCGRLNLSLDEFSDKRLTVAIVDKAFASSSGSTSEKIACKAALLRENLLHPSGL
jgi:hypothetical protein